MANSNSRQQNANVISLAQYAHARRNAYGERPLKNAPVVRVNENIEAIPQQFFQVERSLKNVESILADVDFSADYPLFVGLEGSAIYIQVGIIGAENYPGCKRPLNSPKIVYGRKWLIEAATPTSEVIQTAFLAIKKAREHELREHIYFISADEEKRSTPFNTHIDLPLLARTLANPMSNKLLGGSTNSRSTSRSTESPMPNRVQPDCASLDLESLSDARIELALVLSRVRFGSSMFTLSGLTELDDQTFAATLKVDTNSQLFPEFAGASVSVMFQKGDYNGFLYSLVDALIQYSDRYVQENFTFQGFARFSHEVSIDQVADFSTKTRKLGPQANEFMQNFRAMNASVDARRAPKLNGNSLGVKQLNKIGRFSYLEGYLPQ